MSQAAIARIVVGLDGSEHSRFALDWAIRMARGMGSEVVGVYVVDHPVWYDSVSGALPPQ